MERQSEKNNWKEEVSYPGRPTYPSKQSESEADCTRSAEYAKDTPLGIGLKNKVNKARPQLKAANNAIDAFSPWGTGSGRSFQRI